MNSRFQTNLAWKFISEDYKKNWSSIGKTVTARNFYFRSSKLDISFKQIEICVLPKLLNFKRVTSSNSKYYMFLVATRISSEKRKMKRQFQQIKLKTHSHFSSEQNDENWKRKTFSFTEMKNGIKLLT